MGGLVGKAGGLLKGATKLGGKALPVIGAVMSIYDLVKGVKRTCGLFKIFSSWR